MRKQAVMGRRTVSAVALAAAAGLGWTNAANAGQFSSVENAAEVDTTNYAGLPSGAGRAYVFQDSYDGTNETNRSQSTLHPTDGNHTLRVQDVDGNFAVAWQYLFNNYNTTENPDGMAKFADMAGSTKLPIDITTPQGQAAWSGGYAGLNYAFGSTNYPSGLYVTSYNIADGGNQYQFTASPAGGTSTMSYI